MAHQRRILCAGTSLVEQGFKPAGGAGKKKGFQSSGHIIFYHSGSIQHSAVSIQPLNIARVHCLGDHCDGLSADY